MRAVKIMYRLWCRAEEIFCGTLFSSIVVLVFASALLRWLFNYPLIWADDIAKLFFAWAAFFGADVAMRECRLVGVDFVINKVPPLLRKIIYLAGHLIILAFLIMIVRYGYVLAGRSLLRYFQTINVSYAWVTVCLPLGALAMSLTTVIRIAKLILHMGDSGYSLAKDAAAEDMERQIV